jgi:hypothetical protein
MTCSLLRFTSRNLVFEIPFKERSNLSPLSQSVSRSAKLTRLGAPLDFAGRDRSPVRLSTCIHHDFYPRLHGAFSLAGKREYIETTQKAADAIHRELSEMKVVQCQRAIVAQFPLQTQKALYSPGSN